MSTKGHEGPRRKPLRDHDLVCPRRAGENTFLIHEGPRRIPLQDHDLVCPRRVGENTFSSTKGHEGPRRIPLQDHDLVCPRRAGENTFYVHGGPRRTTEKTFARIINWSVHEGRGRTTFLSMEGHEGPRRKPLQGHKLVCPRRAGEDTFLDPRRAAKGPRRKTLRDHDLVCPRRAGENTFFVHEGSLRKPLVVDSSRLAAMMG